MAVAYAFLTATSFVPEVLNFKHVRGRCICVRTGSHAFCASNDLFYLCHMIPASGVARPKIWVEPKNFGGPNCLILGE